MCGIAGAIGRREIPEAAVEQVLDRMGRRGPDHRAALRSRHPGGGQTLLLHSRLGIIDLDPRSNQPFRIGRRVIVTNGELYNYLELRARLEEAGVTFQTRSDTEVLLRALGQWGLEGLDRCEGMWAFALLDERAGTLTLCRDRFGEKPLYWTEQDGGVVFGSEVKFIQGLLGRPLRVNVSQLYRYLVNGYKSLYKGEDTFFEGLRELPAGGWMRIHPDGRRENGRYWTPGFSPEEGMTRAEAVAGIRERLIRSVELRLRADVPLAFCMSGGVDSNGLIGIAKRLCGHDVHGFTIVSSDHRYDEAEAVAGAVADLQVRHTPIPVRPDRFLDQMTELVRQHDAPVYTITYFAHWQLMRAIRKAGYKISISGSGADELFSGYYDHHLAYLYEIRREPALLAASRTAWTEKVQPWVRNPFLREPDAFFRNPAMREHIYLNAEDFAGYLTRPWSEPFREAAYTGDLLRNRMLNELFHEAVPVILHEDDLNAMYFSIENRSPYLDRSLFEFAYSVPTRHLIHDGLAKSLLRDALAGIAPEGVRTNPRKVGFNAPIFSYLDVRDPEVRGRLLGESPIFEHVRRERIEQLIDQAELPNSESKFLFYFLSAKLFLEAFS
ncbi:MAG: asparagine synthase (glutamine-hydrolyzing) [Candidatus Omnitrophica bacterium CG11_big_fil_rev_8_21_14_0_20_64_10]|nr:MAG: asparagine synthase (glutamine-hydrolyzing) [Candidatus Omnitrophica bacterium CG11_big_fil_rev_8_21_14_0_20_64_10]